MAWTKIGGRAHSLALFGGRLAALAPNRQAVYIFNPRTRAWTKIAGAMDALIGGAWDLYGRTPSGRLLRYDGADWHDTKGHGGQVVGICNAVYALGATTKEVFRYDRLMHRWERIGPPVDHLIGGGSKLYAVNAKRSAVLEWSRYERRWTNIGGPGAQFVGVGGTLYGLTNNRGETWRYTGTPKQWRKIGGSSARLIGGGSVLYSENPKTHDVWRYTAASNRWDKVGAPGIEFVAFDHTLYGMTTDRAQVYQLDEANAETKRLRQQMDNIFDHPHYGNRVMRGFLVRELGGAHIAGHAADVCFQPLSVLKLLPYLHSLVDIDRGDAKLSTQVTWWQKDSSDTDTTCLKRGGGTIRGRAPLSDALPTMMWESHNRTLDAVMDRTGTKALCRRAHELDLAQTEMYPGCKQGDGPDRPWADNLTTLEDMATLYGRIDGGQTFAQASSKALFEDNMLVIDGTNRTYQSPITGRRSGPLTDGQLRTIVQEHANNMGKSAVVNGFMARCQLRWKGGSGNPHWTDYGYCSAIELTLPLDGPHSSRQQKYFIGHYVVQLRHPNPVDPPNVDLSRLDAPQRWSTVGGPAAMWVADGAYIYGLTPDRKAIYRYHHGPGRWTRIGGPAERIYAGGGRVYATRPETNDLWRYTGNGEAWQRLGGPGADFAIAGGHIFRLAPDKRAVYRSNGIPGSWSKVGGPASTIHGGGDHLYATTPDGKRLFAYSGLGMRWTQIGAAFAQLAAAGRKLFALSKDRDAVLRYRGQPMSWETIGGDAHSIAVAGGQLYGLAPERGSIWRYQGSGTSWTNVGPASARLIGGGHQLLAPRTAQAARYQWIKELYREPIRRALATW